MLHNKLDSLKATTISYCDFNYQWRVSVQKIKLINQFHLDIEFFYESRNLIES